MADEENIKQQAEMQRQKAAPKPRDRGNDPVESEEVFVLESILKEISDVEINTNMLDDTMADGFRNMIEVQTQGFTQLSEKLVGNKLKEQEDKKEQRGIFGKILEKLDEQTRAMKAGEVPKLEGGFIGTTFAILGGVLGGFAGLSLGILAGLKKSILKDIPDFFKNLFGFFGKVFARLGQFGEFILRKVGLGKIVDTAKLRFAQISNSVRGFIRGIVGPISEVIKNIKTATTTQKDLFTRGFSNRLTGFFKFFKDFGKAFYAVTLGPLVTSVGKSLKAMRAIGKDLALPFVKVAELMGGGKAQGKTITNAFGKVFKAVFRPISTFFDFFKGMFTTFGKAFARLFFPLTIIFGIFDTFKGVLKGAEDAKEGESRLISMFVGGLEGLFQGLFAFPLDLLRKGIGFLLGKIFGQDSKIAEFFTDGFTFKELFGGVFNAIEFVLNKIIDGAVAFFRGIIAAPSAIADFFSGIPEAAGNMLDSVKEWFNGLIKGLLRSILPIQSESDGLVAGFIKGAAQSFIPDGVYEYAGIDKDTGQLLTPENVSALEIPRNGDQLEQEMNITRGQRKQQAVTANSVVDASVNRSTSQVINIVQGNTSNTANTLKDSFG